MSSVTVRLNGSTELAEVSRRSLGGAKNLMLLLAVPKFFSTKLSFTAEGNTEMQAP